MSVAELSEPLSPEDVQRSELQKLKSDYLGSMHCLSAAGAVVGMEHYQVGDHEVFFSHGSEEIGSYLGGDFEYFYIIGSDVPNGAVCVSTGPSGLAVNLCEGRPLIKGGKVEVSRILYGANLDTDLKIRILKLAVDLMDKLNNQKCLEEDSGGMVSTVQRAIREAMSTAGLDKVEAVESGAVVVCEHKERPKEHPQQSSMDHRVGISGDDVPFGEAEMWFAEGGSLAMESGSKDDPEKNLTKTERAALKYEAIAAVARKLGIDSPEVLAVEKLRDEVACDVYEISPYREVTISLEQMRSIRLRELIAAVEARYLAEVRVFSGSFHYQVDDFEVHLAFDNQDFGSNLDANFYYLYVTDVSNPNRTLLLNSSTASRGVRVSWLNGKPARGPSGKYVYPDVDDGMELSHEDEMKLMEFAKVLLVRVKDQMRQRIAYILSLPRSKGVTTVPSERDLGSDVFEIR